MKNRLLKVSLVMLSLLSFGRVEASATCVFKDLGVGEACPVFATGRALEFLDVGDDAIIFIEAAATARTSVVASTRIEDAVLLGQMDEDDGLLLEREVQELSGARYELPVLRGAVKKQLGFPENAEIAVEDWVEILRVHAETVLSISATASRFLLDQVGLVAAVLPGTTGGSTDVGPSMAAPSVGPEVTPTLGSMTSPAPSQRVPRDLPGGTGAPASVRF